MPIPEKTTSQSASYLAEGSLERDMSEVITNISPADTPFLSNLPVYDEAYEMKIEWQTDELLPPGKNQRPEFDEYKFPMAAGVGRLHNFCQIMAQSCKVSDVMQKARKTYKPKTDELSRQITNYSKKLAFDMEYAIMSNAEAHAESGSTLAMMGGIPYFMKEELLDATLSTTDGSVTTTQKHGLSTGSWVMLKGTKLPTELTAGQRYYVRLDDTKPDTKFTLFNSLQDAVEKTNGISNLSDAGTAVKVLINNVVDAGNAKFTLDMIDDAMELAYYRGGHPTQIWLNPTQKRRFSTLARELHTVNRNQTDKKVSDVTDVYESDFGVLEAKSHLNCSDDKIFLMDPSYWGLRYFTRPHLIPNSELAKTGSYEKFVITSTLSLQASQPLASAVINNVAR